MIDETMLPREGLFDRTFSVYLEKSDIRITRQNWQISGNSIKPASSKRLTERKEAVGLCCKLRLRYKREAENDLVVKHSEYSESNLDGMGMDDLLVGTCFCIHLDVHVKDEKTRFSIQSVLI